MERKKKKIIFSLILYGKENYENNYGEAINVYVKSIELFFALFSHDIRKIMREGSWEV